MIPADQGFRANDTAIRVDLRLVVEDQLVALDCEPQISLQCGTFHHTALHLRVVETQAVAPRVLGFVQGQVGLLEKTVFRCFASANQGGANAGRTTIFGVENAKSWSEGLQNSGAGNFGLKRRILGVIAQTAEQDDEFVASETRNGFRFPDATGESQSDHLQQPVAVVVSEDTVERFEVVDVDQQNCATGACSSACSDCLFQTVDQQPSVRQACRRVEERQLTYHLLGFSVCRQVDHRNNEMSDEAVVVFHCGNMQPRRVRFPILAPILEFSLPLS